jgi:osmotically-inducible protein OsmY
VILNGTAGTAAQRELTETYARGVEGVKSVQNKLVVREPGTNEQVAETDPAVGEKIDDTSITAQVKYALTSNDITSALKANVETQNGVVIIRGRASNQAEKELVSQLASSVRGVNAVENGMTVSVAE